MRFLPTVPARSKRAIPAALLTLAAALLAARPVSGKEYMTAGFQTLETRPLSLAVLPPHAEFIKAQAVMTNEMLSEAAALEREAAKAVAGILERQGYKVRLLTRADVEAVPGAADLLLRFDTRYDEELGKVFRDPKGVRRGRFGVGESATEIARALQVDGLVAMRIVAVGNTGGRAALVAALSLGSAFVQSYSKMFLGVVSGNGGRIEGYFPGYVTNGLKRMVEAPDKAMTELARFTLSGHPSAHQVLKPKKKDLQAEAASEEPEEVGEEIIDQFEAAMGKSLAEPAAAAGLEAGTTPPGAPETPPEDQPPAGDPPPADQPPAGDPPPAEPPAEEPPLSRDVPPREDPPPSSGDRRPVTANQGAGSAILPTPPCPTPHLRWLTP